MKEKALTHTKWHVILASSLISARYHFLNACSCCLTPGFAFLSFARTAVGPGHTNEKCQASSGNCFLKRVCLCYLCAGTLLKEPLDWKHSTGKRNESTHPAPASSLLLWGTAVGNQNPSLAERMTNSRMGLFWHEVFITQCLVSPWHQTSAPFPT